MPKRKRRQPDAAGAPPAPPPTAIVAWHGWWLVLPARWNPVKIEGTPDAGQILFADLHRPRLGLRWQKLGGRRFDPEDWSIAATRNEVGQLAADESRPHPQTDFAGGRLYQDPEPPGRDVWVGYSPASKRGVQLLYYTAQRDRVLPDQIVPVLRDLPPDQSMPWSVFGLSCRIPVGLHLAATQLNAGDLTLMFSAKRQELTLRQVSLARQCLARLPIEKWLAQQELARARHYKPVGQILNISLEADGRPLIGICRELVRRRRFFFRRALPRQLTTAALHDAQRDRLLLMQASDRSLLEKVAQTVGWAGLPPIDDED